MFTTDSRSDGGLPGQVPPVSPPPAPPRSADRVQPPPQGGQRRGAPMWVTVLMGIALVVLLVQVNNLRADVSQLRLDLNNAQSAASAPSFDSDVTAATVAPPLDLPPADGEAARRAINDTYRMIFDPATPAEVWPTLLTEPGDLGRQLADFRTGRCAGATAVLTDIRFTGDDNAVVTFRFDGSGIAGAEGFPFQGGARRNGPGWQATPEGVAAVVNTARSMCTGG